MQIPRFARADKFHFFVANSIVNDALGMQLLQKYLDLGPDLALRRQHELRLQLLHNFSQREMSVAEFKDDAARSFHADRAFRKQHDRRFGRSAPAASGGEFWNARISKLSHAFPQPASRQPQSEKPPAAANPARRKRNRARRVAPRECHTCRAMPGWRSPARRA